MNYSFLFTWVYLTGFIEWVSKYASSEGENRLAYKLTNTTF